MNWRPNRRTKLGSIAGGAALALTVTLLSVSFSGGNPDARDQVSPDRRTATSANGAVQAPSYVAVATTSVVSVFATPGAAVPRDNLAHPWFVNGDPLAPVPLVFHVESPGVEDGAATGWIKVMLPTRPNGSRGWVRATDVSLQTVEFRVVVDLGDHRLTVYHNDEVVLRDTVAIGKPATPTPVGRSYIRVLLQPPGRNSAYGPYAYGLSGHSEVLDRFNGGDAEIGIHGNNDASVLGRNVSSGCIRMSNDKVTKLATLLPLGTPVVIHN